MEEDEPGNWPRSAGELSCVCDENTLYLHKGSGYTLACICQNALTACPRCVLFKRKLKKTWDFPGGPGVKNPPSNAGDTGSIPGRGTKIPTCRGATKPARRNY